LIKKKNDKLNINKIKKIKMGIGDWGLGIGEWGVGPIPNPQSPIPNPQSPYIDLNFLRSKKIILYINI